MLTRKIPMRPSNLAARQGMTADEMDCLSYYVLSGCQKDAAFSRFVATGLVKSKTTLLYETKQLFKSDRAKKYIDAYERTLEDFFNDVQNTKKDIPEKSKDKTTKRVLNTDENKEEVFNKKKARAIKNFTDYVFDQSENISLIEDPEGLVKIADKMGLFDNLEDNVEPPRRYLPEICSHSCRYRLFCEENLANGNMVDECELCKYKAYANGKGVHYDNTDMLDIPKESDYGKD